MRGSEAGKRGVSMPYIAEQAHVTVVTSRPHLSRCSPHAQPLGNSQFQVRREDEQWSEMGGRDSRGGAEDAEKEVEEEVEEGGVNFWVE